MWLRPWGRLGSLCLLARPSLGKMHLHTHECSGNSTAKTGSVHECRLRDPVTTTPELISCNFNAPDYGNCRGILLSRCLKRTDVFQTGPFLPSHKVATKSHAAGQFPQPATRIAVRNCCWPFLPFTMHLACREDHKDTHPGTKIQRTTKPKTQLSMYPARRLGLSLTRRPKRTAAAFEAPGASNKSKVRRLST